MEITPTTSPWLTLTDLGRLYGISAVHCGHLLAEAGLRGANGQPSAAAVATGQAFSRAPRHHGRPVLWHRDSCGAVLESRGLVPLRRSTLVEQWATLLSALAEGAAAITTSAAQMAEELPPELVDAVNGQLRAMGCTFQVGRPRPAASAQGSAEHGPAERGPAERPQPERDQPKRSLAKRGQPKRDLPEPDLSEPVRPAARLGQRRRAAARAGQAIQTPGPATATPRGDHQGRARSRS